jgi:hypothetical protein
MVAIDRILATGTGIQETRHRMMRITVSWLNEIEVWMLEQRFADCNSLLTAIENASAEPTDELLGRFKQLAEESSVYGSWFSERPVGELADAAQREAEGKLSSGTSPSQPTVVRSSWPARTVES